MKMLVVVTGPPGAGKSSVARPLASALGLPVLDKDTIKEALFDALGTGDESWSRKLGEAAFTTMFAIARNLDAAVLDGNFSAPSRDALLELHASPIEIYCRCDREERQRRIEARPRHPGHLDEITARKALEGVPSEEPLRLGGPFLEVDTNERVEIDAVIEWARASEIRDVSESDTGDTSDATT